MSARFPTSPYPILFLVTRALYTLVFRQRKFEQGQGGVLLFLSRRDGDILQALVFRK